MCSITNAKHLFGIDAMGGCQVSRGNTWTSLSLTLLSIWRSFERKILMLLSSRWRLIRGSFSSNICYFIFTRFFSILIYCETRLYKLSYNEHFLSPKWSFYYINHPVLTDPGYNFRIWPVPSSTFLSIKAVFSIFNPLCTNSRIQFKAVFA